MLKFSNNLYANLVKKYKFFLKESEKFQLIWRFRTGFLLKFNRKKPR